MTDPDAPAVPGETVITTRQEAVDAIVEAFIDGDPVTSQHIVDTLGELRGQAESGRSHVPFQVGTHDAEGFRTHEVPADVCAGCSDPASGLWVPVSQCPPALAALDAEEAARSC